MGVQNLFREPAGAEEAEEEPRQISDKSARGSQTKVCGGGYLKRPRGFINLPC